jgi:NADH dehydrogenase
MCEHADHTTDAGLKHRMLTFVIVGGGYTGIELVTELHDLLFGYVVKHYRGVTAADIKLIVLEASNEILRGVHPNLKAHSLRRLMRKGIELRMQAPAVRCDAHGVDVQGGERIDSETIVWTAGVRAHEIAESLPVEHDRIGRIIVNENLQIESRPEVFVAGDSTAPRTAMEAPRVAPVSIDEGSISARNVLHSERGQPLESYRYVSKGMLVSLGMNYAVVNIGGIRLSGYFAWLFWNAVHLYKLVGLKKQLQVAIDWAMALIFPRDAMIVRRPRRCPICDSQNATSAARGTMARSASSTSVSR